MYIYISMHLYIALCETTFHNQNEWKDSLIAYDWT